MRIYILSDLHIEFAPFTPPLVEADLVVLSGDTNCGKHGVIWARETFPDIPVLYLLGNHEYYGNAYPSLLDKLRQLTDGSNVRVLCNPRGYPDEYETGFRPGLTVGV